jgi:fermentation-respiration switch protein FrsA (DUF1100 family)
MKKITSVFFCLFLLSCSRTSAQGYKVEGNWFGKLILPGTTLRIEFHFSKDSSNLYTAFLKSPDQTDKEIPADRVEVKGDSIKININSIKGYYSGKIQSDTLIEGIWNQGGREFALAVSRTEKLIELNRPQNPKKPYPYKEEEVVVVNKEAGVTLAGTFTYPEKGEKFPAVILITGSGPQNRDEELLGHKPFLVLSDFLTKDGIAVLRCDDRGIGKSTGNFSTATTKDFATDIFACVEYLKTRKEIDSKKIGLIGHSEGGLIAPMVAVGTKDVAFIVMMAGPGLCGDKILELQSKLISKAEGTPEAEINKVNVLNKKCYKIALEEKDSSKAAEKLNKLLDDYYASLSDADKKSMGGSSENLKMQTHKILSPWFKFFLSYDPKQNLSKLKIPVLAVNGEKDLQVPPKENLEVIESSLKKAGNKNYMVMEFPGLNHLFQTAETGSPTEYSKIEQTMAPAVLFAISDWIHRTVK